jgi:hypothetical protein
MNLSKQASSDRNEPGYRYPTQIVSGEIDWVAFRADARRPGIMATMSWKQRYMAAFFDLIETQTRADRAEAALAEIRQSRERDPLPAPVPFSKPKPLSGHQALKQGEAKHGAINPSCVLTYAISPRALSRPRMIASA